MSAARVPLAIVLFLGAIGNGLASLFLGFVVLVGGFNMAWLFLLLLGLLIAEIKFGLQLLRNPTPRLMGIALGLIVVNAAGWYLLAGNSIGPIKAWEDAT